MNEAGEKKEWDYPFFTVSSSLYEHPSGAKQSPYYKINTRNWVGLFGLTRERQLVVVEQYRVGINQITLEVPGGVADGPHSEEEALREFREETGYEAKNVTWLGDIRPNPAMMNNTMSFYGSLDVELVTDQKLDDNEYVNVGLIPIEDFEYLILNGVVSHALIIAGYFLFKKKMLGGKV